jgi:hypothetical protein
MTGKVAIAKDDGTASPHILWEQWRIARVFRAYQLVISLEKRIVERRPGGSCGILVGTDPLAVEYQQRVVWRKEVIESHLLGKSPNPYAKVWYRPNKSMDRKENDEQDHNNDGQSVRG